METYMVQARLGDLFEDLYVTAASPEAALEAARALNPFRNAFTAYVL